MNDELKNAIIAYYEKAVTGLDGATRNRSAIGNLEVITNPCFELRLMVEKLEDGLLFTDLVKQTRTSFRTDELEIQDWWKHRVQNFFRRSGFYNAAYAGKGAESDELIRAHLNAFERREIERIYLAPMEYLLFDADALDFGAFAIQRFSAEVIDSVFRNDITEVFYPNAVADSRKLDDYWFLRVPERISVTNLFDRFDSRLPGPDVTLRYTPFPGQFEMALQQLALYDWRYWGLDLYGDDEPEKGCVGFNIPFVLVLDDDLLSAPNVIPDLSVLETEPDIMKVNGREIEFESPARGIEMTEEEEVAFKEFMMRVGSLLEVVRAHHQRWPFFVLALKLLAKAFITDGPEQLLWHITALESLLGENKPRNTNRLARRIGSILGADANAKGALDSRFRELYGFRCKLVHGNQPDTVLFRRHLREARELARQTVLWFLHYLKQLPESDLPTREELLRRIDLETS